ncbi:MAG: HD domain-containing protein [Eggerthellaceae bacterium]|jgi:putative nucleotidyltransferase with HDIG domain
MRIDRANARRAFDAYVAAYDGTDPKIRLKADHTYRVADLCERISRSLPLPEDDVDLAWLCGLLHDIGRFEQVRRFGTFKDAESVSHAALGAQILFGEGGIIRRLAADSGQDALVRAAVAEHSDYRLPSDQDERTRTFCDIVRDADKIDIVKVNCVEPVQAIYDVSEAELAASSVSPQALAGFAEHRTLRRGERVYPADYVVGHICFAFELAYSESRRLMRQQGYLDQMLSRPFSNAQTAEAFARMRAEMRAWLDARERG